MAGYSGTLLTEPLLIVSTSKCLWDRDLPCPHPGKTKLNTGALTLFEVLLLHSKTDLRDTGIDYWKNDSEKKKRKAQSPIR